MHAAPNDVPPAIPMPVLPMSYTPPPVRSDRPAIITAIGVMSIVLAALGMIASIVGGIYVIALTAIASSAATMSVSASAANSPNVAAASATNTDDEDDDAPANTPGGELRAGPRGLASQKRAQIVDAMNGMRAMSKDQRERLHQLLAKAGQDIFPFSAGDQPLSINVLRANVNDHGEMPSASADRAGQVWFVVGTGKLEILDDRATFFAAGGDPVRVARGVPDAGITGLTQQDIDAFIAAIETSASQIQGSNVKLNPAQSKAIADALRAPRQKIVNVSGRTSVQTGPPAQQLMYAMSGANDSIMFQTMGGGAHEVDRDGTLKKTTPGAFASAPYATVKIRKSASTMAIMESVFSGLLAIYLLICGILILRQHNASGKMHVIYALLKIAVVILGACGWIQLLSDWTRTSYVTRGSVATGGLTSVWVGVMIGAIVSVAYPIALLIALRTKTARDYFSSARTY